MYWSQSISAWRRWSARFLLAALLWAGGAQAQGFSGRVEYTGGLGPVTFERPLCLCLYDDPGLTLSLGCLILTSNPATYQLSSISAGNYYLVVFVDLDLNEQHDADEPFEIYRDRSMPPADPVSGTSGRTDIDFVFGDENLPATPTATPTDPPTSTPSPSPTATTAPPTPTPMARAGDCNHDGAVSIDELVRAVTIALGVLDPTACPAADLDHDGTVRIDELITVLNSALGDGAPPAISRP